jgi:ferritin-like metal-binding protein YciE
MSTPENLEDIYIDELADNWSANDQMRQAVTKMAEVAGDDKLRQRLEKAVQGIEKHTETIKQMLDELGEDEPEHCKGMEGLVKEAHKHAIDADIEDDDVRDVVIITSISACAIMAWLASARPRRSPKRWACRTMPRSSMRSSGRSTTPTRT